ncbi:MAG TPA: glycosyltransferase family 2 protein [Candidatus Thermoplasmatota archaeon]|nr:glycosyltransferase family 2 protein [Candidatus Thermoplasmatota archaeon]
MAPRKTAGFLSVLLAGAAGGALGVVAHAGYLITKYPRLGLTSALTAPWSHTLQAYVLGGALLGLLVAGAAGGFLSFRALLRDIVGAGTGAAGGFLLYALGYLSAGATRAGAGFYLERYWEVLDKVTVAMLGAAILGGLVGLIVIRFRWRLYGVIAYVSFVSVVAGYFAYVFQVALPRVPVSALPFSMFLLWAEGMSLAMVVVHTFYGLDNFVKSRWDRTPDKVPFARDYLPRVAFHYACFNEPPEIVFDALSRLAKLDYPQDRYIVMVCDDSTDEASRAPVERFCREHGFTYIHRKDRRGFKAGALNNALKLTPEDVEIITVIDADYHVEPEYLRETVGYFIDPKLGFLQTPQDYRNVHQSFLTRQYYCADGFFYRAIMPSRNEANAISFCGTMGMVRRDALDGVGGWAEDHVTEDMELSVRLLAGGWRSLYLPKTFGKGLIPPTYDAYKKQHHRWAFGGGKVLRAHWRKFVGHSSMTGRQRFDFFFSCLQWFDGVYTVIIAAAVAAIALGEIRGHPLAIYHRQEIFLVGLVPVFLLADGFARLHLALRRSMNLSMWGTLKVMGVWYAIKFVHMRGALKAALGFRVPFVRTPKAPEGRPGVFESFVRAIRLTQFETACFLVLTTLACVLPATSNGDMPPAKILLWVWLCLYSLLFIAAPLYAYKAFRTFVPDEDLPTLAPGFQLPRGHPARDGHRPAP